MQSVHFYKPVELLINTILTGKEKVTFDNDLLVLNPAFTNSLKETKQDQTNLYLLSQIEYFLKNCTRDSREKLVKFFIENDRLLTAVNFIAKMQNNSQQENASESMSNTLHDFAIENKQSTTLIMTIYYYIENLNRLEVSNHSVSEKVYWQVIKFNSKVREDGEV